MTSDTAPRKRTVEVLGKRMAYVEMGRGDPVVFLHGNPASSYLWRDVMPHAAPFGRCIALDLIGMGDSEKLDDSGPGRYRFVEHRKFLDGALDALGVASNVVWVVHDWGSALGFDWANRHRGAVRGIAYMEALVRPVTWAEWPDAARRVFRGLRSEAGERMVLENNVFVERVLPGSILRRLTEAEMAIYRAPYAEPGESRRPTLTWPREIPIEGQPPDVTRIVQDYAEWMSENDLPKLFVNAEPGAILTGRQREFCRSWRNQQEVTVRGRHFVQEDAPHKIGEAVADFVRRLGGLGGRSVSGGKAKWRNAESSPRNERAMDNARRPRDSDAAKRRFELPGIQDLSKKQEEVRALCKEGRHLIVGGPGTGKTVVALLRARRHQREGDDYVFLVYNHLLHRASAQLFPGELSSATWEAWLMERFGAITDKALPRKSAEPGKYRPIDWESVLRIAAAVAPPVADARHLVIDEGQDMPPPFYRALVELGFERFFVTADQNQQIHDDNSSRRDIETELGIDTGEVVELKHNYRNSGPVARLAAAFRTDDPASPPVVLPSRPGPPAWLCAYEPGRFADICRRIVKIVDLDPATLVGVIAPNNKVRERYVKGLRKAVKGLSETAGGLDHGPPRIETFYGDHRPDVRFDEGGILVINAQACKGLEFDIAVLADIDQHYVPSNDLDAARKRFYVMAARARERVILLRQRGAHSRIDEILPDDPDVLRRKDVT